MSTSPQFTLFTHKGGPNGWKVAVVLEELGLTYESKYLDFQSGEQKAESHTKYNPNGRIPTLIDHQNNDFAIWESGAIISYLADKYDHEHKISVVGDEVYTQLQWLFFQASGQGPYYGQAAWFTYYHPEKIQSAVDRYMNEIKRVLSVLNGVLSKQEWLVGGKATVADLSFVSWNDWALSNVLRENFSLEKEYPAVAAWHAKLGERPSVKKIRETKASLSIAHNLSIESTTPLSSKPQFTLFSHSGPGPNGWKVAIILEELDLKYESKYLNFWEGEQKAEAYTKYNPNGRIPTLIDHGNNDFVIWESCAIITYLVGKYDPEHKISVAGTDEKYTQLQWLFFQASGQGPYFGQVAWFDYSHPEKVPSALERYANEMKRVLGVVDGVLSKQAWLVGGKPTVADWSMFTWNDWAFTRFLSRDGFSVETECPAVAAWHAKLSERASVRKILAIKASFEKQSKP